MGVPKFYRWISERYPCLSEVVKEYQVPEFDNLYLDMNGIIHNCSHPNDDDPHFRITEEQIFKDIFHYIEVLFRIVRPKKNFFMAVDGVAPRAKMNQQRGRRFRSAKEAEVNIKQALLKGETLPTEKRFDSNCITPGTKFMEKLQTQLEYFVKSKITSDQTWQGVNVYLSGHQTPGEGEHKIMEYIRHERSQPGYNPNIRHCLYGLDADLMMLALCSHEPHFALLREEVKFTRRKSDNKTAKAEETTFHLLHISLMREYIEHEFEAVKETLAFPFDLESIIDDWVLMGFLVGNDFIPHLPDLHISSDALPLLYRTYIEVLPTLDGYLNEGGMINLSRFQRFLKAVSAFDVEHFEEIYEDYKWLESKGQAKKNLELCVAEPSVRDIRMVPKSEEKSIQIVKDLAIQQGTMSLSDNDSEEDDGEDEMFYREFKLHKKAYYSEKFNVTPTNEQIQCIAFEYILGLQWICHYYYNGVQSWSWYYPYHYSPYLSDLTKVADMKLKYKMNKPFLPYQQLLAVLPEASKDCIPEAYWTLMEEKNSVIGDFYPTEFSTDLNGKKQEWEAVVLIPFIDETRLLEAMESCTAKLSKEERSRNQHGLCQLYTYDANAPHYVKSTLPNAFPDIPLCCTSRTNIPANSWTKKNFNQFVKGLLPGCQLSVYYQGFPTLYHLHHKAYLKKQQVKVFQANSRNENMILKIVKRQEVEIGSSVKQDKYGTITGSDESLEEIAQRLLGRSVYVNWPHMEEAKVVSVSDGITQFALREEVTGSRGSKHKLARKDLSSAEVGMFAGDMHDIHERCLNRRGIDLGETNVLVYAQLLLGRKYVCSKKGEITLEKQWSSTSQPFALQMTLKDISVQGPTLEKIKSIEELFPKEAVIFSLDFQHYGYIGKVIKLENENALVELEVAEQPNLHEILRDEEQNSAYFPGYKAASMSRITPYLLSRITGSIFVFFPGQKKWNVGLSLKFTKDACGIAGYTKRKNNNWYYSSSLVEVVRQYQKKYSKVFQYLEEILSKGSEEQLNAEDIFPTETTEKLKELSTWLKSLPCHGGRKVHETSSVLEPSLITGVDETISNFKINRSKPDLVSVGISPHSLFRPMAQQGSLVPDKNAKHQLLDRVVNVRMGFTVPLGYQGTIVGVHAKSNTEEEVMFDVMFDEEFLGGLTLGGQCPQRRGYKLPSCAIINLSYGERTFHRRSSRPVAVVRPHHQQNLNNTFFRPLSSPAQPSNRSRFVQSPHSAFTPAKKSISQSPSGDRPGHVTLLQRGSGASRAPQSANSQRKELSLKKKNGHSSKTPVKSSTTDKSSQSSQQHKVSSAEAGIIVKSTHDSTKGTPTTTTTSTFSLSQAAQSLPVMSKSKVAKPPTLSTKLSSTDVHTVSVTKSPITAHATSTPGKSQVKKIAIQTLLSRQSEQERKLPSNNDATKSKNTNANLKDPAEIVGLSDAVKTTLKIPLSAPHVASVASANDAVDGQNQLNQLLATLQVTPNQPPPPLPQPQPNMNKPFSLQAFLASNPPPPLLWGYPPVYPGLQSQLMRPEHFQPPPTVGINAPPTAGFVALSSTALRPSVSSSQAEANSTFLKEGTDKLCEILSIGEDEKLKEDGNVSKTKEEEIEKTEDETSQSDESKSDNDVNSGDEDRSVSVEETTHTDGPELNSRIDELLKWCQSHNMFPPVYTYRDTDNGKEKLLTSTVQVGNGLSFQSSLHSTREKAMEEAAFLALQHLSEGIAQQVPIISQGVPSLQVPSMHPNMMVSYPSYFVNDMTGCGQPYHFTQDGKALPPHPYMLSPNPAAIPFSVPPPPIPVSRIHPAVIQNFVSVTPGGNMLYPRPPVRSLPFHPSQQFYPATAGPGVYTPPFVPRGQPTYDLPQPHYASVPVLPQSSASDSIKPVYVNNNPFIPSQVKYSTAVSQPFSQNARVEATGSANYVLSDSPPVPASSNNSSTPSGVVRATPSRPKKPKAKLAISFAPPTK